MKRLASFYLARAKLIGALYCAIPVLAWFLVSLLTIPYRQVYLLRLGLVLTVGCTVAALLHDYGVKLWVIKHRSAAGPAGVLDGMLIGMSTGLGINFLPPLVSLIASNHLEEAKSMIIIAWLAAGALGAIMGAVLGAVGKKVLDR
jgi:hypothetical protein